LLWGDDLPRTAAKALQTHISSLRRTLGDGGIVTEGAGWTPAGTEVDASRYTLAARMGRDAAAAGDTSSAVARLEEALTPWRGTPELPDSRRGVSENALCRRPYRAGHACTTTGFDGNAQCDLAPDRKWSAALPDRIPDASKTKVVEIDDISSSELVDTVVTQGQCQPGVE
jgi:hypothetical protein